MPAGDLFLHRSGNMASGSGGVQDFRLSGVKTRDGKRITRRDIPILTPNVL